LGEDNHGKGTYRGQNPALADALDLPLLVLTAFQSEVTLKAMIASEGGQLTNGHNLMTLFKQLKPKTQAAVEAEWNKLMADKEEETKALDAKLNYKVPRDLRQALEASKDSFAQLRYIYETGEGSSFIINLPLALNKVVLSRHPGWRFLLDAVK
jgi:hypothetical protein